MGSTILFTHLNIILLQCFQFSVFSNNKFKPDTSKIHCIFVIFYYFIFSLWKIDVLIIMKILWWFIMFLAHFFLKHMLTANIGRILKKKNKESNIGKEGAAITLIHGVQMNPWASIYVCVCIYIYIYIVVLTF